MLIDTHAHLYWDSFKEDFDEIIQRAIDTGISTIVNVGVDIETSKEALRLAKSSLSGYSSNEVEKLQLYSTIGIHPHETVKHASAATSSIQKDMDELEKIYLSDPKKVIAIGECGLDFLFHTNDLHPDISLSPDQTKALQKNLFQAQIDLAKKLNLPLVVHCRDNRSQNPQNSEAWNEVIEMVGNHPTILHCYSGLSHTTSYILHATNLVVSFAANITYPKNEYLREAAKTLPLEKILLETDCPFLAPQSKRGQRNEPANVKEIAEVIADLKGISFEEIANQTTTNAISIFSLQK